MMNKYGEAPKMVFEIRSTGIGKRMGVTNEPITDITTWNERLFVRTESGRVWVSQRIIEIMEK